MEGCLLCNSSSGLNHYFGKGPFLSIKFPWRAIGNVLSDLWGALALSEHLLGRWEETSRGLSSWKCCLVPWQHGWLSQTLVQPSSWLSFRGEIKTSSSACLLKGSAPIAGTFCSSFHYFLFSYIVKLIHYSYYFTPSATQSCMAPNF